MGCGICAYGTNSLVVVMLLLYDVKQENPWPQMHTLDTGTTLVCLRDLYVDVRVETLCIRETTQTRNRWRYGFSAGSPFILIHI